LNFSAIAAVVIAFTPIAKLMWIPRAAAPTAIRHVSWSHGLVTGSEYVLEGTPHLSVLCSVSTLRITLAPLILLPHPVAFSDIDTACVAVCGKAAIAMTIRTTDGLGILVLWHLLVEKEINPAWNLCGWPRRRRVGGPGHIAGVAYT